MKKIISLVMAFVFVVSMPTAIYAIEAKPERMNMEQLQVTASYFFWTDVSTNTSEWDSNNSFDYPIPLYSLEDELIAYYIKTLDENGEVNGYMIVNAFWDNPCVLEYGYGANVGIKIDNFRTSNEKIYYNLAGEFFTEAEYTNYNEYTEAKAEERISEKNEFDLAKELATPNNVLKNKINNIYLEMVTRKNSSERSSSLNPDWDILDLSYMPVGRYTSGNLPFVGSTTWARTRESDYPNTCGPTSGTNMLIYYGKKLNTTLVTNRGNTIDSLYEYMDTDDWGPGGWGTSMAGYRNGLEAYLEDNYPSRNIRTSTFRSFLWTNIKSNISGQYMVAAYLEYPEGLTVGGAHYINYIGWRTYEDNGANYIRVLNQWDADDQYYVLFDSAYQSRQEMVVRVEIT